jgi:hypothetical protein
MAHCCRTWVSSSLRIAATKRTAGTSPKGVWRCHGPSRFPILAQTHAHACRDFLRVFRVFPDFEYSSEVLLSCRVRRGEIHQYVRVSYLPSVVRAPIGFLKSCRPRGESSIKNIRYNFGTTGDEISGEKACKRRSAKPLGFLPSLLEGRCSIQLSYGRTGTCPSF